MLICRSKGVLSSLRGYCSIAMFSIGVLTSRLLLAQPTLVSEKPITKTLAWHSSEAGTSAQNIGFVNAIVRETTHGGKLAAPIDIQVKPGRVLSAIEQEVVLSVTTTTGGVKVSVEVEASNGLATTGPTTRWEFVADSGVPHEIRLPLRIVKDGPRRLLVAASMSRNEETQSTIDTFRLAGSTPEGGLLPDARLVKTGNGRVIQEVPGRVK
jgi:hypothetical protein